jgi:hypothetical protein
MTWQNKHHPPGESNGALSPLSYSRVKEGIEKEKRGKRK